MSQTSDISTSPSNPLHGDAGHGGDHHVHDPHVAHHFDSMGQQVDAGKLGMWVFLATEILMFGGLFCAYAVYRGNHPEVFAYAHHYLDTSLGALNTVILIASSLTMAWAVRCSQLGKQRALLICLVLTLLGGFGFLCVKTIEYNHKAHTGKWIGSANMYHPKYVADKRDEKGKLKAPQEKNEANDAKGSGEAPVGGGVTTPAASTDGPDRSAIAAPAAGPAGVSASILDEDHAKAAHAAGHTMTYEDLPKAEQERVHIFFQIYYLMTGLHSFHVILGMFLIFWLVVRAAKPGDRKWIVPLFPAAMGLFLVYVGIVTHSTGVMISGVVIAGLLGLYALWRVRGGAGESDQAGDFGPTYFAPVDIVGLYWHLVDLIWIFLFPLLYLIH